jgi:Domain of unknown function (DUF4424)
VILKRLALICILPLVLSTRAFGNDTSAELATGGLIFEKSEDIEMRSEDLFISMKEVRVQYHFYNHADRDVTTQIAAGRGWLVETGALLCKIRWYLALLIAPLGVSGH